MLAGKKEGPKREAIWLGFAAAVIAILSGVALEWLRTTGEDRESNVEFEVDQPVPVNVDIPQTDPPPTNLVPPNVLRGEAPQEIPVDGQSLWASQKAEAFQNGKLVVVSQGCFNDRIKVAWASLHEPEFAEVHSFGIKWGLSPDYASREYGWEPIHPGTAREFEITREMWERGRHSSSVRTYLPRYPEMRVGVVIHVWVSWYWSDDGSNRLLEDLPVTGYIRQN